MMTCAEAEEHVLESLDGALPGPVQDVLAGHLATCARCAAFSAGVRVVDLQLTAALSEVGPPVSVAEGVWRQVRRERISAVTESLPDLIHLTGCTIATVLSAALLPVEASTAIATGIGFTCVSYVFMAVIRWSIEAAGQPDW